MQLSFTETSISIIVRIVLPLFAIVWARNAVPLSETLPYRWGTYLGYAGLIYGFKSAILMVLLAVEALTGTTPGSAVLQLHNALGAISDKTELMFTIPSAILDIVGGIGLIQRRRFGVLAYMAGVVIALARTLFSDPGIGWPLRIASVIVVLGLGFINVIYFRKRWALLV